MKKNVNIFAALIVFAILTIGSSFFVDKSKAENQYVSISGGLGSAGQVLTSNGPTVVPSFQAASGSPNTPFVNGFRLTVSSGNPVPTTDVTNATTVYLTPYTGSAISVFDGASTWSVITSAEINLALGTLSANLPYDVFVYNNAGTLTIDTLVAWTNTTTRATALALQNGVYVKTGATTRLYVGTIYTTSTTQTQDTARQRLVYNQYNQVQRAMSRVDTTDAWTGPVAAWRYANNSATNRLEIMNGLVSNVLVQALNMSSLENNGTNSVGIGENVNNANPSAPCMFESYTDAAGANNTIKGQRASLAKYVPLGFAYYSWMEFSSAANSFYGDNGNTFMQAGICGQVTQ